MQREATHVQMLKEDLEDSVRSSNTAGQDMLKMWRRVCRCKRIKEMKEKEEEEEEEEESPVIAPVPITKQWREEVRPFLELRR